MKGDLFFSLIFFGCIFLPVAKSGGMLVIRIADIMMRWYKFECPAMAKDNDGWRVYERLTLNLINIKFQIT